MRLFATFVLAVAACASAPRAPEPSSCDTPSPSAEVEQIQVGWNAALSGRPEDLPIVDVARPVRYERQASDLAAQLLDQCRAGKPSFESLQKKYSEADPGAETIDARDKAPYRAAALCLKPNECALVRSNYAFHVVKRIN